MAIPQWETPPCATDRIRQWETPPTAAYGLSFQKATFRRARLVGTSTVSEAPSPIPIGLKGYFWLFPSSEAIHQFHSIPGMGPSPPLRSPAFHTDGIQL